MCYSAKLGDRDILQKSWYVAADGYAAANGYEAANGYVAANRYMAYKPTDLKTYKPISIKI